MTGPTVPWSKTRCLGAHCQKLTFQHALSLPVQNVHVAPRCALVRRTDRWGTRLGGLDDRNKSAQDQRGVLTSHRFGQRSRIMTATSIGRIVVPSLAVVAACGAALVVGITHVRRERGTGIRLSRSWRGFLLLATAPKEVVKHRKDLAAVADLAHRQRRSIGAQTLIQRPKR